MATASGERNSPEFGHPRGVASCRGTQGASGEHKWDATRQNQRAGITVFSAEDGYQGIPKAPYALLNFSVGAEPFRMVDAEGIFWS